MQSEGRTLQPHDTTTRRAVVPFTRMFHFEAARRRMRGRFVPTYMHTCHGTLPRAYVRTASSVPADRTSEVDPIPCGVCRVHGRHVIVPAPAVTRLPSARGLFPVHALACSRMPAQWLRGTLILLEASIQRAADQRQMSHGGQSSACSVLACPIRANG